MAFLNLANEILAMIGDYIDSQNTLYALIRTCRRLYTTMTHLLYRFNMIHHNFSVLCYLSEYGYESVIRHFLAEDAYLPSPIRHQWRVMNGCVNFQYDHCIKPPAPRPNPLSGAAKNGHEGVTRLLLFELGVNPNIRDTELSFPLNWAAENGHLGVAKLLVESGGANLYAKGMYSQTPLTAAGVNGQLTVLRYLHSIMIAQGQGTAIKETCDALSMVIEMGQTETVPFLLDATMDINMRLSPLHTPLSLAARLGRVDIVELLVDRGAEMEARPDATQSTPLIMAAENGREGVMWLLLAAGANPDVFDKKGFTPLHYVARAGKENAVRLLLASNADTSFRDGQDGKTAEELASEMGHRDVAVLLSSSLGRSPICQSCVDSTVP